MTSTRLWITALVTLLAVPGVARAQTQPCASASDCAQGMVCHGENTTTCSGGTTVAVKCDPSAVCPTTTPASDPICTDTMTFLCVYDWQLPCNLDVDCGDGFLCRPATMGTCSGAAPVSDGGTTAPPVCVTTTSFPGSCQAKIASCTSDTDCPSIWKCVDSNVSTAVGSGPMAIDAGVAPGPASNTATLTATTTATLAKTCQSPNVSAGRPDGVGTTPTVGYNASPDGGATTKGTTTPPTTVQSGGGTSTDTKTSATLTRGGCALGGSVTPGRLPDFLGLLGLLGAMCLRRFRRR